MANKLEDLRGVSFLVLTEESLAYDDGYDPRDGGGTRYHKYFGVETADTEEELTKIISDMEAPKYGAKRKYKIFEVKEVGVELNIKINRN